MNRINWRVRVRNKNFWIAFVPALILLAQQVAAIFGVTIDMSEMQGQILSVIGTVFAILAILGVVEDPTTKGVGDSSNALTYEVPKEDTDGDDA